MPHQEDPNIETLWRSGEEPPKERSDSSHVVLFSEGEIHPALFERPSKDSSPKFSVAPATTASKSSWSEEACLAAILSGIAMVLIVHAAMGKFGAGAVEIERLPERKYELRIDPDAASEMELLHLPGIGPVLARRIVEYRQKVAPIRQPEDLTIVKGIGPKTLEEIKPYLRHSPYR